MKKKKKNIEHIPIKTIEFPMSAEQVEFLALEIELIRITARKDRPIALIAQVFPEEKYIKLWVLPNFFAAKLKNFIQKLINKFPKTNKSYALSYKKAEKRLKAKRDKLPFGGILKNKQDNDLDDIPF